MGRIDGWRESVWGTNNPSSRGALAHRSLPSSRERQPRELSDGPPVPGATPRTCWPCPQRGRTERDVSTVVRCRVLFMWLGGFNMGSMLRKNAAASHKLLALGAAAAVDFWGLARVGTRAKPKRHVLQQEIAEKRASPRLEWKDRMQQQQQAVSDCCVLPSTNHLHSKPTTTSPFVSTTPRHCTTERHYSLLIRHPWDGIAFAFPLLPCRTTTCQNRGARARTMRFVMRDRRRCDPKV